MSRSKKDGRKGGSHRTGTRSKWLEAKAVRRARIERRNGLSFAVWEHEQEMDALERELVAAFEEQCQEDQWDWTKDYHDWRDELDLQYDPLDDWSDSRYDFDYDYDEKSFQSEVVFDTFQAVDRAVRRHGVDETMKQASLLAAALDTPVWDVIQCINLTRAGYIRRSS